MNRNLVQSLLGLVSLLTATSAFSIPTTYTSRSAFDTAISNAGLSEVTLNFDSTAAGTTIGSGGSLGGITFTYNFGGVQMAVTDGARFGGGGPFDTTSSPNFLGTDDSDIFQGGDDFSLSFGATNAIGMYFISADTIGTDLFDDDIELAAAGASALLDTSVIEDTLPDLSNVFFLGVVDPMATFTTASVTSPCSGCFFFNVDDIVTATAGSVPEPSNVILLGIALTGWAGVSARRRRHV